MTAVVRPTPDQFAHVDFAQAYPGAKLAWQAPDLADPLELHVIDAPAQGEQRATFLLLHGEPSWSQLYADWIPRLTAAGYRCVAVDLPGFGRSDKPTDDQWYSYERHCAALRFVIDSLDLSDVHLVVQDWAGPIGLRQAVDQPQRFSRLFIFNTWLHHPAFEYGDGVRTWHAMATNPEHLGGDMPVGRIVAHSMRRAHDNAQVVAQFDAPFTGIDSKAGARAFPAMLPFSRPDVGGAEEQERCHHALLQWQHCPVHLVFGDADVVFTVEHGQQWAAAIPGATFDRIPGAGHFVQYDAADDCLAAIAGRLQHAI